MDRKYFSILVTSNRKGATRNFVMSSAWLKTIVVGLAVGLIILLAGSFDYIGLLMASHENKRLRAENIQLHNKFQLIEGKVGALESSIDRVNNFTTKLKLITNIKDEGRTLRLSMGSFPKSSPSLGGAPTENLDRGPSSEFLRKDSVFLQKAPLDRSRGEIGRLDEKNYASLSVRIDRVLKESSLVEQGVLALREILSERQSLLNHTPSVKPVKGWFSSRFGYRADPFTNIPTMHNGLDIAAPPGSPVRATADGIVAYVGYEAGYGKLVTIDHGKGVKTRFGHNSRIFVTLGQKVKRWDVISAVGSTGRSSGPHSHYEVRVHEVPVDPANYILTE